MAWLTGWDRRKSLTIASADVTGDPSGFQVRVRSVNDSDIGPAAQSLGQDFRCTSSDGETEIPFHLVEYRPSILLDGMTYWLSGPVSVLHNGVYYCGWVNNAGEAGVFRFDPATNAFSSTALWTGLTADDHNCPALCFRADGRLVVFLPIHNGDLVCKIAASADSIASFGAEIEVSGTAGAYCWAVMLPGVNSGRIYIFRRQGTSGTRNTYAYHSDDGGATWSLTAASGVFSVTDNRPYFNAIPSRTNNRKIHFWASGGNPAELATASLYYMSIVVAADGSTHTVTKADGTGGGVDADLPMEPADIDTVYSGATNRCWVGQPAADADDHPCQGYTAYVSTTDVRYRYARWSGSAWVDNQVATQGGDYSDVTGSGSYYPAGIALDRVDPNNVYLIKLDAAAQVQKYVTADDGATWGAPSAVSGGCGSRRVIRPVCPVGATDTDEIPVFWTDADSYADYTDFTARITAPYGPVCQQADVDLWVRTALSDGADTVLYLYYGNDAASDGQDEAGTWPSYVFVATGGDEGYRSLRVNIPAQAYSKVTGTSEFSQEVFEAVDGNYQFGGGGAGNIIDFNSLFDMAGADSFYVGMDTRVDTGTSATSTWVSCFDSATPKAGFLVRSTTVDAQIAALFVTSAGTSIGGKFPDLTYTPDTFARYAVTYDKARGTLEAWKNGTKSATTFASVLSLHATATGDFWMFSSPHSTTQRLKGALRHIFVSKNYVPSDDFIETRQTMLADLAGFTTLGGEQENVTLLTPADLATDQPTTLTFSWTAFSGADHYHLFYTPDGGAEVEVADIAGTSHQVSGLDPNTEYTWYILAHAADDEIVALATSETWTFTTAAGSDNHSRTTLAYGIGIGF